MVVAAAGTKRENRLREIENVAVTFKSDTLQHFFHPFLPLSKMRYEVA